MFQLTMVSSSPISKVLAVVVGPVAVNIVPPEGMFPIAKRTKPPRVPTIAPAMSIDLHRFNIL
jgi:hypothetical protein